MADQAHFVIITALEEEREAVLKKLPRARKLQASAHDVQVYYSAYIPIASRGETAEKYRVIVLSLLGMGRVQAATATSDAIRRWKPLYVIMVGIAGGVAANGVKLGDVLVPDQIADYELQKLTLKGSPPRWKVYPTTPRLLSAAQNLGTSAWQKLISVPRPVKGTPRKYIGPIASGDKVVAANDVLMRLLEDWPKLIGIEMEAGGVAVAAFQASNPAGFFMIRGVSDLADEAKGSAKVEQWRSYACDVAAAYTIALIKSKPLPRLATSKTSTRTPKIKSPKSSTAIPLPKIQRPITQLEKDKFLIAAYNYVKRYFKKAIVLFEAQNKDIDSTFEEINNRKFICRIYIRGELKNQCKIWIGGLHTGNAISYDEGRWVDPNYDNRHNESLSIDDDGSEIFLRASLYWSRQGFPSESKMPKEIAAEYLWRRFIATISTSM